jgi:hypothetical protein
VEGRHGWDFTKRRWFHLVGIGWIYRNAFGGIYISYGIVGMRMRASGGHAWRSKAKSRISSFNHRAIIA